MLDTDDKLILILILLNVLSFFIGFIVANFKNTISHRDEIEVESFFTQQKKKKKNKITIDETKVVSKINTDNLEKKYDKLGDTKQSQENITSSISKLKNMKG